MASDLKIDTMKLYSQVERIYNELRELGYTDESTLDVEALFEHDQYHFYGIDAVDEAIERAGIRLANRCSMWVRGLAAPLVISPIKRVAR